MTKSVIIDGVEYVPKTPKCEPKITEISVSYEPLYAGYGNHHGRIPVKAEFTVVSVTGKETVVEIPYPYAKTIMEAICE